MARKGQFKSSCKFDSKGRDCARCGEYKQWEEYHKLPRGANGRNPACKSCLSTKVVSKPNRTPPRKGTIQDHCDTTWDGVMAAKFIRGGL